MGRERGMMGLLLVCGRDEIGKRKAVHEGRLGLYKMAFGSGQSV